MLPQNVAWVFHIWRIAVAVAVATAISRLNWMKQRRCSTAKARVHSMHHIPCHAYSPTCDAASRYHRDLSSDSECTQTTEFICVFYNVWLRCIKQFSSHHFVSSSISSISLSLYLSIIPSPIPFSILFHFPNSPIYLFLGATIGPICTDTIHFISFRVICCLCNDAAQMNSIAPYLERKIELMPDVLVSPYFNCLCKSIKFSCTTPRMRLIEIMALCI